MSPLRAFAAVPRDAPDVDRVVADLHRAVLGLSHHPATVGHHAPPRRLREYVWITWHVVVDKPRSRLVVGAVDVDHQIASRSRSQRR
jgi:hypothetical protein